jgi:hypothetical protein
MIRRFALSFVLTVIVLISGCSSPYNDVLLPPMTEIEAMTELIDQEVGLTADQRIRVRELVSDNASMRNRIQQQFQGRMLDLKDQEKSRLQKLNRQLEVVFTPEQFDAWKPLYRAIYNNEMEGYNTPGQFQQQHQRDDFGGGRGY